MSKWGTKTPPKQEGRYLVTYHPIGFSRQVRQAKRFKGHWGDWAWCIMPDGRIVTDQSGRVIAWMKEPMFRELNSARSSCVSDRLYLRK